MPRAANKYAGHQWYSIHTYKKRKNIRRILGIWVTALFPEPIERFIEYYRLIGRTIPYSETARREPLPRFHHPVFLKEATFPLATGRRHHRGLF
jgi:hypothetical protein